MKNDEATLNAIYNSEFTELSDQLKKQQYIFGSEAADKAMLLELTRLNKCFDALRLDEK